ncbi:MAG: CHAT domain-containing protein [Bacteroidota bacterium]
MNKHLNLPPRPTTLDCKLVFKAILFLSIFILELNGAFSQNGPLQIAGAHSEKAKKFVEQENPELALAEYDLAVSIYQEEGHWEKWMTVQTEKAALFFATRQLKKADSLFVSITEKAEEKALEDLLVMARLKWQSGRSWSLRGNQPKAIEQLESALAICEANSATFTELHLEILLMLGAAHGRNANLKKSIEYHQQGWEASKKTAGATYLEIEFGIALAEKSARIGDLAKALDQFKKIHERLESMQDSSKRTATQRVKTFNQLGAVLVRMREYDKAVGWLDRAEAVLVSTLTEEYSIKALNSNIKGICFYRMFEYEKAIAYYARAKEYFTKAFHGSHPAVASAYNNLGTAYEASKNFEKAVEHYEKALKIRVNTYGEKHPQTGQSKLNLGNALLNVGRYDSAKVVLQNAVLIYENAFGNKNMRTVGAYASFAANAAHLTEFDTALFYCQKSLAAFADDFDPESDFHQNPALAELKGKDDFVLNTLQVKSEILLRSASQNKNDGKRNAYLKTVLDNTVLGNQLIQYKKESIDFQHMSKSTLWSSVKPLYDHAVRAAILLYQSSGDPAYLDVSFKWAETGKSLLLLENYNKSSIRLTSDVPEAILAREKAIQDSVNKLETQIFVYRKKGEDLSAEKMEGQELFEQKQALYKLQEVLKQQYPSYYSLRQNITYSSFKDVENILDEKTLLVELVRNRIYKEWYLLTTDSDGQKDAQIISIDEDVPALCQQLIRLCQSPTLSRPNNRRKFIEISHQLYQFFIRPIEKKLIGKEKLIIIGEGYTNYIPFEILLNNKEDRNFKELNYLLRNFEISYHYSATLFKYGREKGYPDHENKLLAFAPVFSKKKDPSSEQSYHRAAADTTLRAFDEDGHFTPLYHSEKEVRAIAELFEQNAQPAPMVLLNEEATEAVLKKHLGKKYRYVHIASHSFAHIDQPNFSGIACAFPTSTNDAEDGILHVGEIYNLEVQADLLVLSSCESGIGKLAGGEGLLGLNRSFVFAGVPNVIFSLWKVSDKTTSTLMENFYKEILAGHSYPAALRKAKLKMLDGESTYLPNLWSAFLIVGR